MDEKQISPVTTNSFSLSDSTYDYSTSYTRELFVAYPDCSLFHFCGDYQLHLGRVMMNTIRVCGVDECLLFCLLMAIKM